GLARLRVQAEAVRSDPDGLRHRLYAVVRFPVSGRVGTAHEHDRGAVVPGRSVVSVAVRVHPRQLSFALPHAESLTRDNFLEGPANAAGLALIDAWPEWPGRTMLVGGPGGAGKSHLAAMWAEEAGARSTSAHALTATDVPAELATGTLVVEDLKAGDFDEGGLFHLLNLA